MTSDPTLEAAAPDAKNTEAELPDDPVALVGRVVDERYEILEFIGQGGMGSVYRAEHITIRRPVALKLLHHSLARIPELRGRFEREAFAIGRIDHPNCVNVSDFGKLRDGSLFLVMEFLEGESLGDLLDREKRLPPQRALRIIRHVLRGLRHAHEAGIVHRDVKPENVHVVRNDDDRDFAKVLDFGIAKLVGRAETASGGGEKLTQAGIAFGTPAYLSPEQAVGQPADPRSDLYSVTIMLFELCGGRTPFHSEDKLELLAMHATQPPPSLVDVAPGVTVSPALEAIFQRGLAKRPDQRFRDASEYIDAIDAVLGPSRHPTTRPPPIPGHLPAHIPPEGDEAPLPSLRPGRGRILSFAGLVVILLVGVALVMTFRGSTTTHLPAIGPLPTAQDDEVQRAAEHFEKGDIEASEQALVQRPDLSENPAALLQLGHTRAARSDYPAALEAYLQAVEIEPALGSDEKMHANLQLMIDDDGPIYPDAGRILWQFAPDAKARMEAQERLLELAVRRNPEVRQKAFAIADELGFGDEIDRLRSFTRDLEHGRTCPDRRDAVAKLRALGDRRALPALQQAQRQRKKNRCLVRHAGDAIRYLQSLPANAHEHGGG